MTSSPVSFQPSRTQSQSRKKKNTMQRAIIWLVVFTYIPHSRFLVICYKLNLNRPATSMDSHAEELRSDKLYLPLLPHARKKG